MQYWVRNITLPLLEITPENEKSLLIKEAAKKMGCPPGTLSGIRIVKESLDARKKASLQMVYGVSVSTDYRVRQSSDVVINKEDSPHAYEAGRPLTQPVIVGAGPCGLFCAWELAQRGFKPVIVERGEPVEKRAQSVDAFWKQGLLNPESNIQFGEGGAGTFSDGKLNTRTHDIRSTKVLEILRDMGAPEDILYKAKPHIGTDLLRQVIIRMREELIKNGASFLFSACMDSLIVKNDGISGIRLKDGTVLDTRAVVLAIGHSARDTFESLFDQGVPMIAKAFSVGVRVEHHQQWINEAQYGAVRHFKLGAADYQLFEHVEERTAYTFCMCPGGVVAASASEENTVVTNGMSYHARDGVNANSAYVVSVSPADFGTNSPLGGIGFQRSLERAAYSLSGRYAAPVQRLGDFMDGRPSKGSGLVKPSYTGEVIYSDLTQLLPPFVTKGIQHSVGAFERKLRGFSNPDALLTGVETRTSSPVRIPRGDDLQSSYAKGLYPAGEGAGYAGGIMSAAVDGLRVGERLAKDFSD